MAAKQCSFRACDADVNVLFAHRSRVVLRYGECHHKLLGLLYVFLIFAVALECREVNTCNIEFLGKNHALSEVFVLLVGLRHLAAKCLVLIANLKVFGTKTGIFFAERVDDSHIVTHNAL